MRLKAAVICLILSTSITETQAKDNYFGIWKVKSSNNLMGTLEIGQDYCHFDLKSDHLTLKSKCWAKFDPANKLLLVSSKQSNDFSTNERDKDHLYQSYVYAMTKTIISFQMLKRKKQKMSGYLSGLGKGVKVEMTLMDQSSNRSDRTEGIN